MIDKRKPEFERVDLGARRAVFSQRLQRLIKRAYRFFLAVHVDAAAQRQLNACGRLKRRPRRSLKLLRQTLLAILTRDIRDPLVVSKEPQRFRKTRREKFTVNFAVALVW